MQWDDDPLLPISLQTLPRQSNPYNKKKEKSNLQIQLNFPPLVSSSPVHKGKADVDYLQSKTQ